MKKVVLFLTAISLCNVGQYDARAVVLDVSIDTFITEHTGLGGTTSSHGGDPTMSIIGATGWQSMGLIYFDLSSLEGQTVVGDATFEAYLAGRYVDPPVGNSISIAAVAESWTESSTYQESYPVAVGETLDTNFIERDAPFGYVVWTVPQSVVQNWIDNPGENMGLLMFSETDMIHTDVSFATSESDNGPRLSLNVVPKILHGKDIEFVHIGSPGNPPDSTGYGSVARGFNIGVYEITNAQWDEFVAAAGGVNDSAYRDPNVPVNNVSWFEVAQFCNYLTSGDRSQGAYLFSGNNTDPGDFVGINRAEAEDAYTTIFVIPTENEWYKAAYYRPDSNDYSLYPNGSDALPPADDGWNYKGGAYNPPWDTGTGTMEQNGTYDMAGNMWEWTETVVGAQYQGIIRGGSFTSIVNSLNSASRFSNIRGSQFYDTGFRIAAYNLCGDPDHPYPTADRTGDCRVNFHDLAVIAMDWGETYAIPELQEMADNWLGCNDPAGCP